MLPSINYDIAVWIVFSSLITMLIISIIRDLKYIAKFLIKRIEHKYSVGDRVIVRLFDDERLYSCEIVKLLYNTKTKEPYYKIKDYNGLTFDVEASKVILTEREVLIFKANKKYS